MRSATSENTTSNSQMRSLMLSQQAIYAVLLPKIIVIIQDHWTDVEANDILVSDNPGPVGPYLLIKFFGLFRLISLFRG